MWLQSSYIYGTLHLFCIFKALRTAVFIVWSPNNGFQTLFPRIHKDKAIFLPVLSGICVFHDIGICSAVPVQKQQWAVTALGVKAVAPKCTGSHLIFNARHPHWGKSQCHFKISLSMYLLILWIKKMEIYCILE